MAKLPFSVFRRSGRRYYSVSFKNEMTGEYLPAISTKQETEAGAIETAFQWLKDGMPRRGAAVPLTDFLLNFWEHDHSPYIKEKQRKGQGLSRNYT